jgi:hypothetical protein
MKKFRYYLKKLYGQFPALIWLRKKYHFQRYLKKKLVNQLSFHFEREIEKDSPRKRILVPLLETSHYQYLQILIVAKALQLRGADIRLLLCDSALEGCELKNVRNMSKDFCLNCRFGRKEVAPLFGLKTIYFSNLISGKAKDHYADWISQQTINGEYNYFYNGFSLKKILVDSITRFFYGKVPDKGSDILEKVKNDCLKTTIKSFDVAQKIDDDFSPEIIFNNMNVYAAWEPFYQYFGQKGVQLSLLSITPFEFHSVIFNSTDLYVSNDRYNKYKKYRSDTSITDEEKKELDGFLKTRYGGDAQIFRNLDLFDIEDNEAISKLSIKKTKRNLFLFSNVFWDVGLTECGRLFESVTDWVLQTIELIMGNPDCHLYIKTHPAEKYDTTPSSKGIEDFIFEKYPQLPDNVSLILPEAKINTYNLFPYIDTGIVFNGTIGLEMMLNDIPVIVTGKAPYDGIGISNEPETINEYKKLLSGDNKLLQPYPPEVILFAYFYFIKTLIPWTLTKQAYSDSFDSYTFDSLEDLLPGQDKYLDHICNCILSPGGTIIEGWE